MPFCSWDVFHCTRVPCSNKDDVYCGEIRTAYLPPVPPFCCGWSRGVRRETVFRGEHVGTGGRQEGGGIAKALQNLEKQAVNLPKANTDAT